MRNGDRLAAVLPALRTDILGRVRSADDQDVLVLEFHRVAEIVRVQHAAVEGFETFEVGHVRGREVPGGDDHVIELLGILDVLVQVVRGHLEHARALVVGDVAHRRVEAAPVAHAGFLDAALDVIEEHRARRIGCDRPAEVILEKVIGEFESFLGTVRPEVAVHAAVHGFAVIVETRAPGIAPQTAPVCLFFEADDIRNFGALFLRRLECPQLREAARARTDDCYTLAHDSSNSLILMSVT